MIKKRVGIMETIKKQMMFSDKELYAIVIPVIVEQLLTYLVGLIDSFMLSFTGETAMSGVSLVNQINTTVMIIFTSVAAGGTIIVSQYIGRRDYERAKKASEQLMIFCLTMSVMVMLVIRGFHSGLIGTLYGAAEEGVQASGKLYLNILAVSYPFFTVYTVGAAIFRSMGKTKSIMMISLLTNVVNAVGNYIAIFWLHTGISGVAWATVLSRIISAVIFSYTLYRNTHPFRMDFSGFRLSDSRLLLRIFYVAVPNTLENGLFQVSKIIVSVILATFGTVQIAAYGIAINFSGMASIFSLAMGNAFMIVIGQCMGAKQISEAETYMMRLTKITFLGSVLFDGGFLFITPLSLMFFPIQREVFHYIMGFMIIHDIADLLFCPIGWAMASGLKAAGDVRYTLYSSVFSTVVCRTIFTYILGSMLHLGIYGIILSMAIDWFIKTVLIWIRYKGGKWKTFQLI